MTTSTISNTPETGALATNRWLQIALQVAVVAVLAVWVTQFIILGLMPELAMFQPLDNYARSALFTGLPAGAATAIFAWLVKTQNQPVTKFLWIAGVFLLLSFIPDYMLPIPNRTLVASTAAALLHVVAGIVTVAMVLGGYNRSIRTRGRQ